MFRFTNFSMLEQHVTWRDRLNNGAACYCVVCTFMMNVWLFGALIYTMVK